MTSRMAHLLGELRRQMNGAIVGSMRYYGAEYGLNYGVSIPTIRSMGRQEQRDHRFAKYLYRQQVRELQMVSLWFANPEEVADELDFWAEGVINSEIAEEFAFVVLSKIPDASKWLNAESELLQYCTIMAISWQDQIDLDTLQPKLIKLLSNNPPLLSKAVIALLDKALRVTDKKRVSQFIEAMPQNGACNNIREEITWRMY